MTSAISASSWPPAIASMIDCRLLPRPEMRMPRRRLTPAAPAASEITHPPRAGLDPADSMRAARAPCVQIHERAVRVSGRGDQNEPDAHVEGPKHLVPRNAASFLQDSEE